MKLLLLFVNINLSFLFHRFNQYEKHVSELNGHLQIALFFLFNIATITIWNSFKINAFEPQSIKELRFLNISVERNSLEYFFSFVIGYMVLTFIVKAICVDMLGRHISGYKVYKAVLCSSATFWTVMAYESIVISLVQGIYHNNELHRFDDFSDALLRRDLHKLCKMFRSYGKDSLLLATLAYNVGYGTLMGHANHPKSRLVQKIESGDRNIHNDYIRFCCYKGKVVPSIRKRRKVELLLLYQQIDQNLSDRKTE